MSSSMYDHLASGNHYWWQVSDKKRVFESVFAYIKYLEQNQNYRSTDNLRYMRLYGNYEMMGLDAYNYTRVETSFNVTHRVTLNIIQSMIDTVVSKITKNKPKPRFLTSEGDWSDQQKAKKLTKFVEGVFYDTNFYDHATKAFQDSCIFGTGCIKIFRDGPEIKAERIFIDEIKVDDSESFYNDPRQMHQTKYIHKDVLKAMFPDKEVEIERATQGGDEYSAPRSANTNDMIQVIESWHLPSGREAKDGLHAMSISNCTLFEQEYTKTYFPFVFFRWTDKPLGFFGQGLAEQLQGLQLEINKILRTIQVSMHLVSIPKLLVESSSKIVTAHLNNKIGGIIKYAGTPPQYAPLGGIPRELFNHVDRLYSRAYEIAGVSQLSATSQKPSGLNSGKALREFNDIETERFMALGQRYEKAFIKASKIMVDMAKEVHENEGEFKVKVKGSGFIETIKWSEVDLEEDKYVMEVFPTSALSSTPSGRLQDVQELLQAGFISKEDGMKLLDFPDLESVTNLYNASVRDLDKMIEMMIDKGRYQVPEPYQNLQMGIDKCQQSYLYYKSQGAPDDRLELLRRWIEDASGLIQKAAREQQQAQIEAQMAAQAAQAPQVLEAAQAPLPAETISEQPAAMPEPPLTDEIA